MTGINDSNGAAAQAAEATDPEVLTAAELDHLLDEALRETFPASDPISVLLPRPKPRGGMTPQ
jgi:hypothetical protein